MQTPFRVQGERGVRFFRGQKIVWQRLGLRDGAPGENAEEKPHGPPTKARLQTSGGVLLLPSYQQQHGTHTRFCQAGAEEKLKGAEIRDMLRVLEDGNS